MEGVQGADVGSGTSAEAAQGCQHDPEELPGDQVGAPDEQAGRHKDNEKGHDDSEVHAWLQVT